MYKKKYWLNKTEPNYNDLSLNNSVNRLQLHNSSSSEFQPRV